MWWGSERVLDPADLMSVDLRTSDDETPNLTVCRPTYRQADRGRRSITRTALARRRTSPRLSEVGDSAITCIEAGHLGGLLGGRGLGLSAGDSLWSTPTSRATESNRPAMIRSRRACRRRAPHGQLVDSELQGESPGMLECGPCSRGTCDLRLLVPSLVAHINASAHPRRLRARSARRYFRRLQADVIRPRRSRDTSCEPHMLCDKPRAPLHRVAWHIDDRVTQVAIDFADSLPERLCRFEGHPSVAVGDIDLRPRR